MFRSNRALFRNVFKLFYVIDYKMAARHAYKILEIIGLVVTPLRLQNRKTAGGVAPRVSKNALI